MSTEETVQNGKPREEAAPASPTTRRELERGQRLSQSILWKLQRRYFEQKGVDAWSKGDVPHYVTTNPFIASAYAEVVLGWLRDSLAEGLDPGQPVYIIEVGAGSGRFGFLFLKKFLELHRLSALKDVHFTYILTDFTERNLEFWRTHALLQPLVEAGQLDFARFDVEHDTELHLRISGAILRAESIRNPIAVIANYVLDSIPQDAFAVREGKLNESLVTVTAAPDTDPEDPRALGQVSVTYEHRPIDGGYYNDPVLDKVLSQYGERLADAMLLFPRAAVECLRNLVRLSGERLLFLSADKCHNQEQSVLASSEPSFAVHGSFSLMVNFHALEQVVVGLGGRALKPSYRHSSLGVSAFLFGHARGQFADTRLAFFQAVERFGPDDFFTLRKAFEGDDKTFPVEQVLCWLRLSGWDANVLLACFRHVLDGLASASHATKQEIHWALQQVWNTYFSIGEEADMAFLIGSVYFAMDYYPEAIQLFQHSLAQRGPDATTLKNIGLCFYHLRQLEVAEQYTAKALALDPNLSAARTMRILVEADLAHRVQRDPV